MNTTSDVKTKTTLSDLVIRRLSKSLILGRRGCGFGHGPGFACFSIRVATDVIPNEMTRSTAPRLIMFHKQRISARTRFLMFSQNTVCGFEPLPRLAQLLERRPRGNVAMHPGALTHKAEQRLGMPTGSLEAMGDFHAMVDVPGGPVSVFLAGFTTIDPPFAAVGDASFVELPEARMLPVIDLQLLRLAYEYLIGN